MKQLRYSSVPRSFSFIAIIISLILFSACNSDPKDMLSDDALSSEEYYEFQGMDLTKFDIPATIMLPDETANIGASTKPEIQHTEDNFYWDINVGPNFQMHIEDYGDNKDLVSSHKKDLKSREMFEINFLVDEPELVVYKRNLIVKGHKKAPKTVGVNHESYHVYGQKVVDGITYELRSRDEGYEKVIIELMAKSIRSFKDKE